MKGDIGKMKFIKVVNFKCSVCGSKEYAVLNLDDEDNIEIICDECGQPQDCEYEIEEC